MLAVSFAMLIFTTIIHFNQSSYLSWTFTPLACWQRSPKEYWMVLDSNQPPNVYLPNIADLLYLLPVKSASCIAQMLLRDGFLVRNWKSYHSKNYIKHFGLQQLYRVYLVWQRNRLMSFPIFLCVLANWFVIDSVSWYPLWSPGLWSSC